MPERERLRAVFLRAADWLAELKRRYDPENLFHMNQNIDSGR